MVTALNFRSRRFRFKPWARTLCSVLGKDNYILTFNSAVADLGEGPRDLPFSLFWVKKEEMTEGIKASRASKSKPYPPPLSRSGFATAPLWGTNGYQ